MKTNEFVEWENRFIAATRRFPPGRDIPAVLEADELRATSLELWRWIAEQLQAIVAKLPKTKDGVSVVPGVDYVYEPNGAIDQNGRKTSVALAVLADGTAVHGVHPTYRRGWILVSDCYSTQAAAKAAEGE